MKDFVFSGRVKALGRRILLASSVSPEGTLMPALLHLLLCVGQWVMDNGQWSTMTKHATRDCPSDYPCINVSTTQCSRALSCVCAWVSPKRHPLPPPPPPPDAGLCLLFLKYTRCLPLLLPPPLQLDQGPRLHAPRCVSRPHTICTSARGHMYAYIHTRARARTLPPTAQAPDRRETPVAATIQPRTIFGGGVSFVIRS